MVPPLRRRSAQPEPTTFRLESERPSTAREAPPSRILKVVGPDFHSSHPLPAQGELTLGRAERAGIRIDDLSISRQHAVLRIGTTVTLEDLGSANGTFIGGRRLQPGQAEPLRPDELAELGRVMVIVRPASSRQVLVAPRLYTPEGFISRLSAACVEAHVREHRGGTAGNDCLLVARMVSGLTADGSSGAVLEEALAAAVEPDDALTCLGPGDYALMLRGIARSEASVLLGRLSEALARQGGQLRTALASFPEDGRDAAAMLAAAGRKLVGPTAQPGSDGIIVLDDAMVGLHAMIGRLAAGSISVLVLGETGVGKEVVAELVHRRSPRTEHPFVRLNCAALSPTLLESELFGHEKGAFTGATSAKPGLLETAHGGSIFLDEIGELSPELQSKLLRVLEDRKLLRVGGLKAREIDVRFISATNRDLEQEVRAGRFREDLFFRLAGVTVQVPPLRERRAEIEALASRFVANAALQIGRARPEISGEAKAWLVGHSWPGNIRQLKNAMERAVLLAGDVITLEHLPARSTRPAGDAPEPAASRVWPEPAAAASPSRAPAASAEALRQELDQLERQRITDALAQTGGNQRKAAVLLGVSRGTLLARLDAFGIARPRKRGRS